MEKRIFILTGNPGVGKTTVLRKTVDALKSRGLKVGGMVSREIRKEGIRVGFEIVDIETGETGWLAHVKNKSGPKVGRYRVNLNDIEEIGAKAILNAVEKQDVIALDEIGPMELFSAKFKEASQRALDSQKLVSRSRPPESPR